MARLNTHYPSNKHLFFSTIRDSLQILLLMKNLDHLRISSSKFSNISASGDVPFGCVDSLMESSNQTQIVCTQARLSATFGNSRVRLSF